MLEIISTTDYPPAPEPGTWEVCAKVLQARWDSGVGVPKIVRLFVENRSVSLANQGGITQQVSFSLFTEIAEDGYLAAGKGLPHGANVSAVAILYSEATPSARKSESNRTTAEEAANPGGRVVELSVPLPALAQAETYPTQADLLAALKQFVWGSRKKQLATLGILGVAALGTLAFFAMLVRSRRATPATRATIATSAASAGSRLPPPPSARIVPVSVNIVDTTGARLSPYEFRVTYRGSPLSYEEGGYYHRRPETAQLDLDAFGIRRPDFAVVDRRLASNGYSDTVSLVVREVTTDLVVVVQDVTRGTAIPGLSVIAEPPPPRPALRSITDDAGKVVFGLPNGPATVSLATSGALTAEPQKVEMPTKSRIFLSARVTGAPNLPEAVVTPPPGQTSLALADLGNATIAEFTRILKDAYRSPAVHAKAPASIRTTFQFAAGEVIESIRKAFDDVFAEKQVQAHLLGKKAGRWEGQVAWRDAGAVVKLMLTCNSTGEFSEESFALDLKSRRDSVAAKLTDRGKDIVIRPGVRLLQLSDDLAATGFRERNLGFLLGAELVLVALDVFQTDSVLAGEWAKS